MAFSSDWPQPTNSIHQLHESGSILSGHGLLSQQLQSLTPNPNPNHHHGGFPTRLGGSMVEKARQAKLPPPEGALKCPRCNSNNTKFCYYNNYNLTQPRHFCKACRRYWTHGGALRNVPVGGGCRRNNKKGKSGNSKSFSSSTKQTVNAPSPSSGQLRTNQQFQFSQNLYNLTQLGGIGGNNQAQQIDSSLMNDLGFLNIGNGRNTSALIAGNNHETGSLDQFALFDPTTGLYAFQNEDNLGISSSSASMVNSRVYQAAPVKMEEQIKLVSSSRPVSGLTSPENQRNQYFWTGSGFSGHSNELL